MTLQQLEQRVSDLETQVAQLQRQAHPLRPFRNVEETFGLFANDAEFDEIVRLGREFRQTENAGDEAC
jgi:hypothetical protein